jgi:two-component system, cell cycle response regulator
MTTKKDVFNKLKANPALPTPSGLALKLLQLCRSDNSSLSEIAEVIQADPALSAEVLKYANSAFLYTGTKVASIQKATVKLGMNKVVNLALSFSLLSNNKNGNCGAFNYDLFWSIALAQAIAAKTISMFNKKFDPDEMFVCGLLSHMGELAFASLFPLEYGSIIRDNPPREVRIDLERDLLGIDSAELTTELFLDWGLPAPYAMAAGSHEDLNAYNLDESTTERVSEILHISHIIALLSNGIKISKRGFKTFEKMIIKLNGINHDFSTIFDTIVNLWHEWGVTFKIKTKQCSQYDEIKVRLVDQD